MFSCCILSFGGLRSKGRCIHRPVMAVACSQPA